MPAESDPRDFVSCDHRFMQGWRFRGTKTKRAIEMVCERAKSDADMRAITRAFEIIFERLRAGWN